MGLISNSKTHPSYVALGSILFNWGSENEEFLLKQSPLSESLFAPIAFVALPVVNKTPLVKPIFELLEINKPEALLLQFNTAFVIVTLLPTI